MSCILVPHPPPRPIRLFYASGAQANMVEAHKNWVKRVRHPDEVSDTFSGQIADFVSSRRGEALFISGHPDRKTFSAEDIRVEHIPKKLRTGLGWHTEELFHAIRMLMKARKFKANVAVLDSGTTHYFLMKIFDLFGIKVIPVMHNSLYPALVRPHGIVKRTLLKLDQRFLRKRDVIGVSSHCVRQAGGGLLIKPQFNKEYFQRIAPPRFSIPFNVLFVGRADLHKGVLDIPEMARRCGDAVTWTVCGDGPALEILRRESSGLPIEVRGWTSPEDQVDLRSRCQAVIVPTRSTFAEGLAMTAVEAVLSNRPFVANDTVPALEMLREAGERADYDDPRSHADAIMRLATNHAYWREKVDACEALQEQFYDPNNGLAAALEKLIS